MNTYRYSFLSNLSTNPTNAVSTLNKTETYSVSMPELSIQEFLIEPTNLFKAEIA